MKRKAVIYMGAIGATIALTTMLLISTPTSFTVNLTAESVSLSSEDGSITNVTVAPNLSFTWRHLDTPATKMDIIVKVEQENGSLVELYHKSNVDIPDGTHGSYDSGQYETKSIIGIDEAKDPWENQDFQNEKDGSTRVTVSDIKIEVIATLEDSKGNDIISLKKSVSFNVKVTNLARTSESGSVGTGGSA